MDDGEDEVLEGQGDGVLRPEEPLADHPDEVLAREGLRQREAHTHRQLKGGSDPSAAGATRGAVCQTTDGGAGVRSRPWFSCLGEDAERWGASQRRGARRDGEVDLLDLLLLDDPLGRAHRPLRSAATEPATSPPPHRGRWAGRSSRGGGGSGSRCPPRRSRRTAPRRAAPRSTPRRLTLGGSWRGGGPGREGGGLWAPPVLAVPWKCGEAKRTDPQRPGLPVAQ